MDLSYATLDINFSTIHICTIFKVEFIILNEKFNILNK